MALELPYASETRPDTGVYNSQLAIWLFLASELMFFGALFSSYIVLRTGKAQWPAAPLTPTSVWLGTINTAILIGSSLLVTLGWMRFRKGDLGKGRFALLGATVCGGLFLLIKWFDWYREISAGHVPASSSYFGLFFLMTGVHALHVLGGIIVFGYLIGPGETLWHENRRRYVNRIEVAGLYWHFVDLVWVFMFATLYLM